MGCTLPLSVIFLVFLCQIQGSSVVTPVFVQTGNDLHLNVKKNVNLKEGDVLAWKFNGESSVVRYFPDRKPIVSQSYSGRIDVTAVNFSLKLKNLTKADSGVYTAQFIGEEIVTVAEYTVTVQDPVSPVELTIVSGSSDSCNVTVTCSPQDSHINSTFTCDTKTCSQEGGEQSEVTTSGASLHVYVTNYFIVCNHSNQVNWTEDRKKVEQFCIQQEEDSKNSTSSNNVPVVVPVIITLIVLILLAVACYCLRKRRNSKTEKIENTVYEVPQQTAMMQPLEQTPTVDDSVNSPTSTYALVGPHSGGKTLPESLYAQVERPKS